MTYAMPTFMGQTFTRREWGELNRMRLAIRYEARRKRVRELSGSNTYAPLGTDHPALLMRELAHGMAMARIETAEVSQSMQRWCMARGRSVEATECAEHAAQDLEASKAWAKRYCALAMHAKRVIVSHLCARLAHLLRVIELRLLPATVTVEQPSAPSYSALASHLAPQAPPLRHEHRRIQCGERPASHSRKEN